MGFCHVIGPMDVERERYDIVNRFARIETQFGPMMSPTENECKTPNIKTFFQSLCMFANQNRKNNLAQETLLFKISISLGK